MADSEKKAETTVSNEPSQNVLASTSPANEAEGVFLAEPVSPEEPYSIYTTHEKWFIVAMVAVSGLYSPLPANIYYPTIPTLSDVFHQSIESINLTVTVYLVFQGISPMLWGPLSDRYGRRPVYLVCFVILIGSCIGLALCPTDAFWLLMVLRCLQAGGCASVVPLGVGVCGDISTPEERGGFIGFFNLGPMLAPCIAPAIGGALGQHLGWRSIFWFLVIMSAVCLVFIWLFLPETLRTIAGNGSRPLGGIHRSMIRVVGTKAAKPATKPPQPRRQASINPFPILLLPDVLIVLIFTGVIYAVNYTVSGTISSSFAAAYPWLSETVLGLVYLPTGAGMIIGGSFTGKLLDWDYTRIKRKTGLDEHSLDFPKEYARLRIMPVYVAFFVVALIGWGWCIETRVNMAVPMVLQVVLGWTSISILNTTMTLNVDILQKRSSAATACTNFIRCSMAAILIALIDRMTQRLGYGWSYVLLGALCALQLPLMYAVMRFGPRWRRAREAKELEDDES